MGERRRFSQELKKKAVPRMQQGCNVTALARELAVRRKLLYEWRDRIAGRPVSKGHGAKPGAAAPAAPAAPDWKQVAGTLALENRFFCASLAASRATTAEQRRWFQHCVWKEIRTQHQQQGGLTVERMCELAKVNRAGYYRWRRRRDPEDHNMEIRDRIQRICLEHRWNYGYRRVRRELKNQGLIVNEKRVRRLMREDNLLAAWKKKFVLTTASRHALSVFPNIAGAIKLDGLNQVWVADLTYIRLRRQYVYLTVVLDAYSRRVVGWALSTSLHSDGPLWALEKAIAERKPPPGLIHHSDQGVQYASGDYVNLRHRQQMIRSMSRKGNPFDNAACESFFKTLKQEEIYYSEYAGIVDLEASLEEFLERYSDQRRLHSALGYLTPAEFEQTIARRA